MNYLEEAKKNKPSEWYVEHAPALPFSISGMARGFTGGTKIKRYSIILAYFEKGEMDWISLIKDQNKIGEMIAQKGQAYWKKEFKRWIKSKKAIERNFQLLRKKDISKMSDKDIIAEINKWVELNWEERKTSSLLDPFMFYADRKLPELLEDFAIKNPKLKIDINKAREILTRPEDPSFFAEFELNLINIAKEIIKNPRLRKKLLQAHIDRFAWIKGDSFSKGKEYTFNEAVGHLSEILKLDIKKLERENKSWQKNKKIRKTHILKYKFNKDILNIANLSSFFTKWQDLRKEDAMMNTYLLTKFIREVSRRTGIDENYLFCLDYSELYDLFSGKISIKELKKRSGSCLFIYKKSDPQIFHKEDFKDLVENIINPPHEKSEVISGSVASSGRAIGKVKIVITRNDVDKVEMGDILVSTMTRPEHIVAMKKAAAIVTNEGGITCHAALVSRELKIPCIIGTKIATKVLKDGDLVEVDANKGIVKIIK